MRHVYLGGDPGVWQRDLAGMLEPYQVWVEYDTAGWPLERRQRAIREADVVVVALGRSLDGPIEVHYASSWNRPVVAIARQVLSPWLLRCLDAVVSTPEQAAEVLLERFLHLGGPQAAVAASQ